MLMPHLRLKGLRDNRLRYEIWFACKAWFHAKRGLLSLLQHARIWVKRNIENYCADTNVKTNVNTYPWAPRRVFNDQVRDMRAAVEFHKQMASKTSYLMLAVRKPVHNLFITTTKMINFLHRWPYSVSLTVSSPRQTSKLMWICSFFAATGDLPWYKLPCMFICHGHVCKSVCCCALRGYKMRISVMGSR